jgi:error-prone DNA polymerase
MTWSGDFTHLHVASSFSMRYGIASPAALAARAAQDGMPALALTDRDGLYGAVKHIQACREASISPITGVDLALSEGPGKTGPPPRLANETASRITLLARSGGWASLCHLVTAAHRGERGVPTVTPGLVAEHANGLIVLLGPGSTVGRAVAARRPGAAAAELARWRDRAETVIEIVDHHGPGDTATAARMVRLAGEQGIPAVLTNAVRYLDPADQPVAQVLDAARQLTPLGRRHLAGHNARAYLKTGEQMARVAARICGSGRCPAAGPGRCEDPAHQLLAATAALAERCYLDQARDLGIGSLHLPETGGDELARLRQRCAEGLRQKGLTTKPWRRREVTERLDHELGIIARTGLASYFLTVADVADLIRARGIRCAIRGSGAGCLVNYLIGISGIDPLEHGLIMERFLSEKRKNLPDIDLDVESARRVEAYHAIIERYGEERCGCVSMMETYRARSAIRDTAAALGLPPHEIGALAKAFGHIRARGISTALAELPELRASNLAVPQLTSLFRIAERLDGLPRHIAMHPCGVVLSSATLLDRVPMERSAEGLPLCQYDMDDVEAAGMIKLDVLGVRMQSAMSYALAEIERTRGERVDIDAISPGDEPTFEMIRSGRTLGCFQIESPGQRELVTRLEPRDLGDLIVDISLFRPGPVNSDMITPYLDIRHGRRPACYPHEDLAEILAETGGVVIFHEQVLRIVHGMTNSGYSAAERMRRNLSDTSARQKAGELFRAAALRRGYDDTTVRRVWDVLEAFGGFGFCKAHAAAFAIPTYQSAWLKRHYPAAFYAGVLTHDPGMYPKRVITGDAKLSGIPVLPVDVNASAAGWQVERAADCAEGVRTGLREVKGISDAEVARIVAGRPYASLRDFWERARVSRPVTESLVLVGAFDPLYASQTARPSRRDLLARVGVLAGSSRSRPLNSILPYGRGPVDGLASLVPAGELPELSAAERVEAELDILGIDISRHVISFYEEILAGLGAVRARGLHRCRAGRTVLVAGVKTSTQTPAVRSGQRIIFATLDDGTGQINLAFFESVQQRCAARVFGSWLLVVRGRVHRPRGSVPPRTGLRDPGGFHWQPGHQDLAVSVNAAECWDLAALEEIRLSRGLDAVHAAMAAGDVPGPGLAAPQLAAQRPPTGTSQPPPGDGAFVYPTGFRLSPYAETGSPGAAMKDPPRKLWHASQGSSGGWTDPGSP